MGQKSKKMIFVGYSEAQKGHKLMDPSYIFKAICKRDVIFLKNKFYNPKEIILGTEETQVMHNQLVPMISNIEFKDLNPEQVNKPIGQQMHAEWDGSITEKLLQDKSTRNIKKPVWHRDFDMFISQNLDEKNLALGKRL